MLLEQPISLPGDIFEVYASYKRGTAKVIRWLSSSAKDVARPRPYLTSIRELRHFADCVILKKIPVPDDIIHVFRQTIQARKGLTNFYKRQFNTDKTSNENHDYFNGVFEEVYRDLVRSCNCTANSRSTVIKGHPSTPLRRGTDRRWSNTFSCLEHAETAGSKVNLPKDSLPSPAPDVSPERTLSDDISPSQTSFDFEEGACLRIEHDTLDETMYLHTHILQLQQLMSAVKESFRGVTTGTVPLATAASNANTAYTFGKIVCNELSEYNIYNPTQLKERYCELMDGLHTQSIASKTISNAAAPTEHCFPGSLRFHLAWRALVLYQKNLENSREHDSICSNCGMPPKKPHFEDPVEFLVCQKLKNIEYFETEEKQLEDAEVSGFLRLIQDIHQTIYWIQSSEELGRARRQIPLLGDLLLFLKDRSQYGSPRSNLCALAFGLCLFLESYKSVCGIDSTPNSPGCSHESTASRRLSFDARYARLASLGFSIQVKKHLGRILESGDMPCNCLKVNGRPVVPLLIGYHQLMDSFITTKRFDLFYQAPWVSGDHHLEEITRAADYGSKAWHYGYFIGTVLHMYSALVQVGQLEPNGIPVLEALCNTFEDAVFLGKRSTHNVLGCWQRWTGGKIKTMAHRSQTSATLGLSDQKWHFCSVPDASHGGDQRFRSFNPSNVSLLSLLAEVQSPLDDRVVAWIYLPKTKRKKYQPRDIVKARAMLQADGTYTAYMERIQSALRDEFTTGVLPIARLNYFSVYHASLKAMRLISQANHKEDPGYICNCPAEMCLRECNAILKQRLVWSGRRDSLASGRSACESCREQLLRTFGDKKPNDFLWNM
ncbi:hypothetical protein GQ53DRAFT_418405 [Thozetella sp. PMI_491]|nr:hypothetical protein GQ53DRAFT_418405 [Thozetella sp. PMI_491]